MAQNERPRLVVPILLITVGLLFLYANYKPAFDPWPVLRNYWPLILIFIGLGKMWDSMQRRNNPGGSGGTSIGSTVAVLAFVLVLVLLLWHGRTFSRDRRWSSMQHQFQTVERQNAQSVHASLQAAAGVLTVGGGSSHLLDADFNYSDSYGTPKIEYSVANGIGQLDVSQEGGQSTHFGVSHNEWNLHFSNDVPLELKVEMGAGQGHLRLKDLPVTRLDLEMGAGQLDLDLTGDRKKDLDADLEGGVGQATIRLPKSVGVIVHASGGIGTVSSHGLKHDGDEYTNDAYGKTPATIRLKVEGGVGQISLVQEP